jgi:hypothetical protein
LHGSECFVVCRSVMLSDHATASSPPSSGGDIVLVNRTLAFGADCGHAELRHVDSYRAHEDS